jgi:hypothetical protein
MNFNYYVETMKLDADKMQQNLNTFGVNIAARLDQGWPLAVLLWLRVVPIRR